MLPSMLAPPMIGGPAATPSARVGLSMEGKSLFTCSQCGSLLKFKTRETSIHDRIAKLRSIPIDRLESTAEEDHDVTPTPAPPSMRPVIIAEHVWEQQQQHLGEIDEGDGEAAGVDTAMGWRPVPFLPGAGIAPFVSANRGGIGTTLEATIPNRLLAKPHIWQSEQWEVDTSVADCGADGWTHARSLAELPPEMPVIGTSPPTVSGRSSQCSSGSSDRNEAVSGLCEEELTRVLRDPVAGVRRRRLVRRRKTDGSELSWFQELLDCSALLLHKATPSCHDCDHAIIVTMETTLAGLQAEQEQYQSFLAEFSVPERSEENERSDRDWAMEAELHALEAEAQRLEEELNVLENDNARLMNKRRELWSTGADLEELIRSTFSEGAFLQHLLGLSRDERQSVGVFSVHASDMLRRLQRYNVCNDVFHIWHDGLFGTINGLRLGRLPTRPVEWVEINAALGQCVLLLATIAQRAHFEFTRNKLVPRGSYSRVVNMYGKEYNLYSDGGMFRRRGFSQAMLLFLECVDDAGKRAMKEEPSLRFPYKIQRGKIGDLSVQLGNDEQWTKALKYMLTHLKWLLAWIAKRYP